MKIWFPTIRAGSGVDTYVTRLADGLGKFGVDTEITWFDCKYELAPFLLSRAPMPENVDVIHANSWNAFAFTNKGVPLVVTEHHCVLDPRFRHYKSGLQHAYHQSLIKFFERASFKRANRVVAVSRYTAASLKSVFDVDPIVIHNWVDTDVFTPASNKHTNKSTFNLLFAGNRSVRKGWDTVMAVMGRLGDKFQLAATSGLGDRDVLVEAANIRSLGHLDMGGLVAAYQRCDALIFPSRYEGFGYVALEALACGKPVIAASNSALPEIVVDGECGLLCEPDSVDCYVSACQRLADDPDYCSQLGGNARKRALAEFSGDSLVKSYIAVYRELV